MPPYQNYYQGQIPMNQNNYGQSMPTYQNPYMDRMANLQQYQQNLQQQSMGEINQPMQNILVGKVVNDISNVSPNDVPMDGNFAIFPKQDMTEIYCKQWKQDGTIQTIVYRPILEEKQEDGINIHKIDLNSLNEQILAFKDEISERFDKLEKSWAESGTNTTKTVTKTAAKAKRE